MNDEFVEKLIKEGKYKDVLKYLDDPNYKPINDKPLIKTTHEEDFKEFGFDENLIKNLNDLNEIYKNEELENQDKTFLEEAHLIGNHLINDKNLNLDGLDLFNTSVMNKSVKNFNENEVSYMESILNDNDRLEREEENIFEEYLNKKNVLSTITVKETEPNIVLTDEGRIMSKEEKNNKIQKNLNSLSDQLELLLKKEKESSYKIIQLQEIEWMKNEEEYGYILQEQIRKKLFPNLSEKLRKFSTVLESKEFKENIGIGSNVKSLKIFDSNENNLFFDSKLSNFEFKHFDPVNYKKENIKIKEKFSSKLNKVKQQKISNHKKNNDHKINSQEKKDELLCDKNKFLNTLNFYSNQNPNLKQNNYLINFQDFEKLENPLFNLPITVIQINNPHNQTQNKNHTPITVNISYTNNINLNNTIKNSENRILEKISYWEKNFDTNNDKSFGDNLEQFKDINFQEFNRIFVNLYTGTGAGAVKSSLPNKDKEKISLTHNSKTFHNNKNHQNEEKIIEMIQNHLSLKKIPFEKEINSINFSNIFELNLQSLNIKKISPEIFHQLKNLQILNLEENSISKIENLDKCTSLTYLNLNKNNISYIENLHYNLNLEKLSLNCNNISKLENLSKNLKIKTLSLGKNKISMIDELELQIPFIEELILSENLIKNLPQEISMPYLKYIDLNDNKISNVNFFFCPNLEKLFLRDNKIKHLIKDEEMESNMCNSGMKYCNKLKEIDISFNKIEFFSDVLNFLKFNQNLEVLNLNNNPFSVNIKSLFNFNKSLKKIFPRLKTVDNENISNILSDHHSLMKNNFIKNTRKKLRVDSYFNFINNENSFLKYFNAIYHCYSIFDKFNFNTSKKDKDFYKLVNFFNENYFNLKISHFKNLKNFLKKNYLKIEDNTNLQSNFLKYIYKFKHKFEYILNSTIVMKNNFLFRKKKKFSKAVKIQSRLRGYLYFKKFKEKLKGLNFEDDEEQSDDLLNFFNNKDNIKIQEIEMENKFIELEDPIIPNPLGLQVIRENDHENENSAMEMDQNISISHLHNDLETKSVKSFSSRNSIIMQEKIDLNANLMNKDPEYILSVQNKINNLEKNIKKNEKVQNHSTLVNSIGGGSRIHTNPKKFNANSNIKLVNMNENTQFAPIDHHLNGKEIVLPVLKKNTQHNHLTSSLEENNFENKKLNNLPQINHNQLPPIKNKLEHSNDNLSVLIKNYSESQISQSNNGRKSQSISSRNHQSSHQGNHNLVSNAYMSGRLLPTKIIEEIRLIEEECKIAIRKAREEWNFTNQAAEELLSNKIRKTYKKKIEKILQNF
jgi:hypothetical protein